MRRTTSTLALALALLAGCGKSHCQELGEKLCGCTGAGSSSCTTQVEQQLRSVDITEAQCKSVLSTCNAPSGVDFCEWLLTPQGKQQCGLAP